MKRKTKKTRQTLAKQIRSSSGVNAARLATYGEVDPGGTFAVLERIFNTIRLTGPGMARRSCSDDLWNLFAPAIAKLRENAFDDAYEAVRKIKRIHLKSQGAVDPVRRWIGELIFVRGKRPSVSEIRAGAPACFDNLSDRHINRIAKDMAGQISHQKQLPCPSSLS